MVSCLLYIRIQSYNMPKIALFFFLLLSNNLLIAQTALVSGKVSQAESDSLFIGVNPNPLSAQEAQSKSRINAQGEFSMAVPVQKATTADLVYEDETITLFLQPGDALDVRFNAANFLKSLKFKGQGANENNFLVNFYLKFDENEDYQVLPENIALHEKAFIEFLDLRKKDQSAFLERYTAKFPVSDVFKNYILSEIEYAWANDRLTFADLRLKVKGSTITLSPTYYHFLNQVKVNNPESIQSPVYFTFLKNYLRFQAVSQNHRSTDPDFLQAVFNQAKEKLTGEMRNLLLAHTLFESIKYGSIQYTTRMFNEFESLNTDKDLNSFLAVQYDINKEFAMGSPAPNFKLKSATGKEVALSSFRGKVVYLNFWSSKCPLCQLDLPYARELEKEMADKNVVFVNIGVDDEELWQYAVKNRKLTGIQLFDENKDALLQQYKVPSLPAYYLIDTDGTFIQTKAKRPSNDGVGADILQALGKK